VKLTVGANLDGTFGINDDLGFSIGVTALASDVDRFIEYGLPHARLKSVVSKGISVILNQAISFFDPSVQVARTHSRRREFRLTVRWDGVRYNCAVKFRLC
jgi:hypothetical protein